jgi:hypothetical protein
MRRKFKAGLMLAALLPGLLVIPDGIALALCNRTGGSGGDDIYVCNDPPDTDGVYTYGGNDTVTVQAGTTVSSTGSYVIDMGPDTDTLHNYGSIMGANTAVTMRDGSATVNNYGTIDGGTDGVWCIIETGETCTFNNYGTLTTELEGFDISNHGGTIVAYNEGNIHSTIEEGMHLHGVTGTVNNSRVTNRGMIHGKKSGIELYNGSLWLDNSGTIWSDVEIAVNTGGSGGNDTITNSGTIQSDRWSAIGSAGGPDQVTNTGRLIATTTNSGYSTADTGTGDDVLINSGDIIMNGAGTRSVNLGDGSDRMTIRGGTINRMIDGGTRTDILRFEFTGTQAEIAAFQTRINSQTPQSGSATWQGKTYQWQNFEQFQLSLTPSDGSGPTPTTPPPDTPTPDPTGTPAPTVLGPGSYEENHAALSYSGNWTNGSSSSASGGRYTYSYDDGARVNFSFDGSRLTLIRRIDTNRGDMQVCIDGACQTVSNYSATRQWQQPVSFDVAAGTHNVEIHNTDGVTLDLDVVQIEGDDGAPPTSTPDPGCPPGVPAGVTARKHSPTSGSRSLTLEWEDVGADACMGVTQYTVYAAYGSYAQQWAFSPAQASCNGSICTASISLPSNIDEMYWRVTATNPVGEGPSDNQKRWRIN